MESTFVISGDLQSTRNETRSSDFAKKTTTGGVKIDKSYDKSYVIRMAISCYCSCASKAPHEFSENGPSIS